MDTNTIKEQMIDYLSNALSRDERQAFEKFLQENPSYQKKFDELSNSWALLDELNTPEPSKEMDEKFYAMLDDYSTKSSEKNPFSLNTIANPVISFFTENNKQWLYRAAILVMGLIIGYTLNFSSKSDLNPQMAQNDAQEVRESLVLTLLEQPSANKRMQALSETNKLEKVNETVVNALLKTLNNDENVNVRLAAIESLLLFTDEPFVREGIVKSIVYQDSPIVQVTIAKVLVAMQEEGSAAAIQKLLEKENLDSSVREELEKSVKSLI